MVILLPEFVITSSFASVLINVFETVFLIVLFSETNILTKLILGMLLLALLTVIVSLLTSVSKSLLVSLLLNTVS